MLTQERLPLVLGGVLILAFIAWFTFNRPVAPIADLADTATTTGTIATTTSPTATTTPPVTKKKTLPPEEPFVLPAGATAVDSYAYIQNDGVYFRSITGKSPLYVWDANADTFRRLESFMTYPGSAVVNECGAAPTYTYYGDGKRVYFYQVWRTPTFRTSQVDAVAGVQAGDFKITSLTTSADGKMQYEAAYQKATTTCKLFLSRTPL